MLLRPMKQWLASRKCFRVPHTAHAQQSACIAATQHLRRVQAPLQASTTSGAMESSSEAQARQASIPSASGRRPKVNAGIPQYQYAMASIREQIGMIIPCLAAAACLSSSVHCSLQLRTYKGQTTMERNLAWPHMPHLQEPGTCPVSAGGDHHGSYCGGQDRHQPACCAAAGGRGHQRRFGAGVPHAGHWL